MVVEALQFHTPPRNQGQAVELSYAGTEDGHIIQSWHDHSDGERRYFISRALQGDEGDYWNGAPPNRRWRRLTTAELQTYGLA